MMKANIVIGANEEEYNSICNTINYLADLRNDIEEYDICIGVDLWDAITSAERGLNKLWFDFGIELVD